MSFLSCLTMSLLGLAWSEDTRPAPKSEPVAANCLNKPISCCFKDVSLQEACEWFEYLMCVKITIDDDAMRQARSEECRHTALEVEDMPFEDVLNKLLTPMGLTHGMDENGIRIMLGTVVTPAPATEEDESVPYSEEEPGNAEPAPSENGYPSGPLGHPHHGTHLGSITTEALGCAEEAKTKRYSTILVTGPDGKMVQTKVVETVGHIDLSNLLPVLDAFDRAVNAFVTPTPATEQNENVPNEPTARFEPCPKNAKEIESRLNRPMSVHFQKEPLQHVVHGLEYLSGINIVLDKAALSEANIGLDQPLSLEVENISMKCILNLLLREVHLTYVIKDDALVITTAAAATGGFKTATYSVAKYLERTDPKNHCEDKLIKLITNTIAPESWESMGGPGKIQYFPNEKNLVIAQQTQDVHEQIWELFRFLDRVQCDSACPKPCTVEQLNEEPKAETSLINTPFPPSLRGLVSGLSEQMVQVVFPVCDLVVPADAITPVVCKMLDKPFRPLAKDGSRRTIEGDLIELITSKVDPESWESHGGVGKIQYFPLGMSLVVVNTKEVQKKVADLLDNIRQLQDKQDKEYVLEMKLMAAKGDGDPEALALPKVTMMQGRWFTMFQGKTVTLKDGSIQDLLADGPDKGHAVIHMDMSHQLTKKNQPGEDDVMVGVIIRAKVTTLQAKLVRLDLIVQKNELDSATRDDIVVVGNSVRSAQRIPTGEAFNHVLEEGEDGSPLVWLEARVTAVPAATDETFRPTDAKPAGAPVHRGTTEPIPRP